MTSFLAASVLALSAAGAPAQVSSPPGKPAKVFPDPATMRGNIIQKQVWTDIKESIAIIPDSLNRPFGVAVLINTKGHFVAHSSSISNEPTSAVLEDGTTIRLGRIGFDSTTQLVLLGAQNWSAGTRPTIRVSQTFEPTTGVTLITASGPARGQFSRRNIPGVVAPSQRYLPMEEVQLEIQSVPVGGALLFNRTGELVGVLGATLRPAQPTTQQRTVTSSFGPQGLTVGYSLNAKVLNRVFEGFKQPDHKVQHPNIGVLFKDSPSATGPILTEVNPESPAQKAGLKTGDVIAQVNDKPLRSALEFATLLFDQNPGELLKLSIIRNNQRMIIEVTVGAAETPRFNDELDFH